MSPQGSLCGRQEAAAGAATCHRAFPRLAQAHRVDTARVAFLNPCRLDATLLVERSAEAVAAVPAATAVVAVKVEDGVRSTLAPPGKVSSLVILRDRRASAIPGGGATVPRRWCAHRSVTGEKGTGEEKDGDRGRRRKRWVGRRRIREEEGEEEKKRRIPAAITREQYE